MKEQINQLFGNLLNPNTVTRNQAETQIRQLSTDPVFDETLLSILSSNIQSPSSTNLLQSIYLKNFVYEHLDPYQKDLNTAESTFKLKDVYLQTYYNFNSNTNECIKIKHNLNLIIIRIAEFLYPNDWPMLMELTTASLSTFSASSATEKDLQNIQNTLYILKGIFTYYLEDNGGQDCEDEAIVSAGKYLNLLLSTLNQLLEMFPDNNYWLICISLLFKCIYRLTNQIKLDTLEPEFLKHVIQKAGRDILIRDPYPLTQLFCYLIEQYNDYVELIVVLKDVLTDLEINNKTLLYLTLFIARYKVQFTDNFFSKIFSKFMDVEREDFNETFTFFSSNNLDHVTGDHSLYNIISNDKIELESICLDRALKMTEYQLTSAIIRNSSFLDNQFNAEKIKEQINDIYRSQDSTVAKLNRLDISLEIISKTPSIYLSLGSFILEVTKQNRGQFLSAFIAVRYCSHITFNAENFALIFNFYSFLNNHLLFMICFSAVYPRFLALNLVNEQQKNLLGEVNFLNILNLESLKVLPLLCNDCHKVIETLLKANLFSLDNLTLSQNKTQYLIGQLRTIVQFLKDITEQDVREYNTVLTTPVFCILGEILCILITQINKLQNNHVDTSLEEASNTFINFLTSNKVELDPGYTSIIQCLAHLHRIFKMQNTEALSLIYKDYTSNWASQKGQLRLLKVVSERLEFNVLIASESVQKLIKSGLEDIHLLSEVLSLSLLIVSKIDDPFSFTISIVKSVVDFIQKEANKTNKHTHGNTIVNVALLYFSRLLNLIGIIKLNELMESIQSGLFQEIVVKVWLPNIVNFKCVKKIEFEEFLKGTEEVIKSFNEGKEKSDFMKIIEKIKIRGAKMIRNKDFVKEDDYGEGGEFYDLKTSCVK